jgi:hypothetical protein
MSGPKGDAFAWSATDDVMRPVRARAYASHSGRAAERRSDNRWIALNEGEEHSGRPRRLTATLFPIPYGPG